MPIDELMALYNCRTGGNKEDVAEEATEGSGSPEPRPVSSTSSRNSSNAGMESEDGPGSSVVDKEEESELHKLYPNFQHGDQRHLRSMQNFSTSYLLIFQPVFNI